MGTAFASTPNTLNMSTVHVKGISSQTSEKEIRDFFSFCGKIQSLSVTPESSDANSTQSASVTFEKETAAKTALLLDNTQLGPAQVSVSSANCSKNPDEKTTDVTAEQAEMEKVTKGDGKEGTKCNCGGADGKCPCPPGQCTCSGCSKAS